MPLGAWGPPLMQVKFGGPQTSLLLSPWRKESHDEAKSCKGQIPLAKRLFHQAEIPPYGAAKGLSGRPLETFGAHDLAFVHGGQSHVQPRREAKQTKTQPPAGHSPAPMEVDDRPCEAVLAGDSVIATLNMLCHGGPGGRHSCRLNLAAPRPLCYFLRGESRTKQAYALQGQNTFA